MPQTGPLDFKDRPSDAAAPAASITRLFGKAAGLFTRRNGEAAKRLLNEDDVSFTFVDGAIGISVGPSDASEISVLTHTFTAGELTPNVTMLEWVLGGWYVNSSATGRWFKPRVKLGGTTVLEPGTPSTFGDVGTARKHWEWRGTLYVASNTSVRVQSSFLMSQRDGAGEFAPVLLTSGCLIGSSAGSVTVPDLSSASRAFALTLQHEVSNAGVAAGMELARLAKLRFLS